MAVDSSGNVFVTGSSALDSNDSDYDYTTIKYSSAGVPLWIDRYQGLAQGQDFAMRIAVDGSGNVIVTGISDRVGDPDDRTYNDYATIKYSNAGVRLWVNRFTFPTYDNAETRALAFDSNGTVFVTGYVEHTASSTSRDFATVAYSSTGVPLWTNLYNGPGDNDDEPKAIAVDSSGNVFVTGYSSSTNTNFSTDAATIAYSGAGVPLWTNLYHGLISYRDVANAVAVDGNGNVFVTGWSQTTPDGMSADFVTIKYSAISPPAVRLTIQSTPTNTLVISWPSPSTGFQLQQNTNGLGSVNWSNVTGTIQDNGTDRFIIVNPPAGNSFYRLIKP